MERYRKKTQTIARFLLSFLLFICMSLPVSAMEIPKPTDEFYVNDFSGILSQDSRDYIMDINLDLNAQTGAQLVVVTMDTLDGDDLETFSTDLFRSFGIGDKDKNNGILFLIVKEDRDLRIEVGYGLEGTINDAKAGRILDDYVIPYLSEDKWDEGILNGFNAIVEEVAAEYGLDITRDAPVEYTAQPTTTVNEKKSFWEDTEKVIMLFIGISVLAGAFFGAVLPYKSRYGIIPYLVLVTAGFYSYYDGLTAGLAFFSCGLFAIIGWALTGSVKGGSSGGSSHGSSSRRDRDDSYRSSGSYSGGGGSSGGGGASRKF